MKISRLYLYLTIAAALGAANSTFVQAASDDHDHDHEVQITEEENTSRIDSNMATQVGIGTTAATEQTLHQTITSYGCAVNRAGTAQPHARTFFRIDHLRQSQYRRHRQSGRLVSRSGIRCKPKEIFSTCAQFQGRLFSVTLIPAK